MTYRTIKLEWCSATDRQTDKVMLVAYTALCSSFAR